MLNYKGNKQTHDDIIKWVLRKMAHVSLLANDAEVLDTFNE